jgi:hypothetical protein
MDEVKASVESKRNGWVGRPVACSDSSYSCVLPHSHSGGALSAAERCLPAIVPTCCAVVGCDGVEALWGVSGGMSGGLRLAAYRTAARGRGWSGRRRSCRHDRLHSAVVVQASPHPQERAKRGGEAWGAGREQLHQRRDPTTSKWIGLPLRLVPCSQHVISAYLPSTTLHVSRPDLRRISGTEMGVSGLDRRRHSPRLELGRSKLAPDRRLRGGFGSLTLGSLPASLHHFAICYSRTWRHRLPRTGPASSTCRPVHCI